MILADQPDNLPNDLKIYVSSCEDGTMLDRQATHIHPKEVVANRINFLKQVNIDYSQCVYQIITYGRDNTYDVITNVSQPNISGVSADVLYTETSNIALFLPVADCITTVFYDPLRGALALAHLGRHSAVADTIVKVIQYFIGHGSHASDISIWMMPSVGSNSYKMEYFDNSTDIDWQDYCSYHDDYYYLDLQGYNKNLAIKNGILTKNIHISKIDTATSPNYFSHSRGDMAGRFAVVAVKS